MQIKHNRGFKTHKVSETKVSWRSRLNAPLVRKATGVFAIVALLSVSVGISSVPNVAKATGPFTITCDDVEVNGNIWTFSGTWEVIDFPGQADAYNVSLFAPADADDPIDGSSKDAPDTFITSQTGEFGGQPNNPDQGGTWSNQIEFNTPPASVAATLHHSQVKGAESGDATCTFDLPDPTDGTLVVQKVVVNDDAGTMVADEFAFQLNGGLATGFNDDGGDPLLTEESLTLPGGTVFLVEEIAIGGYTPSYQGCSGTITAGVTSTCTITNDDNDPTPPTDGTLVVQKVVINDDGGTMVADDFAFQVSGDVLATGFDDDGGDPLTSEKSRTLPGGTVFLVEEIPFGGYTASFQGCSGTITAGVTSTCTITNDDNDPTSPTDGTLVVQKVVVNDDAGTMVADEFAFQLNGGLATGFNDDGGDPLLTEESLTLPGGTVFLVEEIAIGGYTPSYQGCSGTITAGVTSTCTITNDDNDPQQRTATLTITKNGDGNGTVDGSVDSVPQGTPFCDLNECDPSKEGQVAFEQSYPIGTVIDLTATPDENSNFDSSWSGACTGNGACQVTLNSNQSVNAHFALNQSGGGGNSSGGGGSGSRTNDDEPEGQVLGQFTGLPFQAPGQVAGATLPRTGMPTQVLAWLIAVAGLPLLRRKLL